MADDRQVEVVVGKDGSRTVRYQVALRGQNVWLEHNYPDAIEHFYRPSRSYIRLYSGSFRFADDDSPYDGEVRFSLTPTPQVRAYGQRMAGLADVQQLVDLANDDLHTGVLWTRPGEIALAENVPPLPPPPTARAEELDSASGAGGMTRSEKIEQALGDGRALEYATFLLPNGWRALDAAGVCDSEDRRRIRSARTVAEGAGWRLTFDELEMSARDWRELRHLGEHQFTHIGKLERSDGEDFDGDQAFETLATVRRALSLALGRRTTCLLPVGWKSGQAVWTRWRRAPVDLPIAVTTLLDMSVAATQVSELVAKALEFAASGPVNADAFRRAMLYYMSVNVDLDVDVAMSMAVPGLLLVSSLILVTNRAVYGAGEFEGFGVEKQIRLLVQDLGLQMSIPPAYGNLAAASDRLAQAGGPARDAVGMVVKLRNVVSHPKRSPSDQFSVYEWAEAALLAKEWLSLGILRAVNYVGPVARVESARGRRRQVDPVPWQSGSG